ncbi:MAG TPA: COX15/CtaA family protein [Tepidisphaeraceae bacterium]|jgi:cytochrome c oxidase assembly protein subunit 15|nr:COX15/CtaA family protein [Tepidisphaeraceae bacterium]
MTDAKYNPALHRIALLTAIATFPLIFMGGLVTSNHAGLAVPDWPNSYGYNMFLFPPRLWIGGILYEHTHRLMATVVGFCSIILCIAAFKWETRKWARRLAYSVLAAVIFQGVLGGLRVVFVNLDLAIVHGCFAQAFFCLATFVAIATSKWWFSIHRSSFIVHRSLIPLAIACTLTIYLQLIVGATMRHNDAGLAIPDLPFAYGHLLPPTNNNQLSTINYHRAYDLNLPPVTLAQIWLHFAHRIGAILVTIMILTVTILVFRNHRRQRALLIPAITLLILLATQITLGVLTVLLRKPADIASAHVAVGASVLVTAFTLAVRAMRLYSPMFRRTSAACGFADQQRPAFVFSQPQEAVGGTL